MSKKIGNRLYLQSEEKERCAYCGKVAELRPYGKNGAKICFECGMKNIKTTREMFSKQLEGVDVVIVRQQ